MDVGDLISDFLRWQEILLGVSKERNDLVIENKRLNAAVDALKQTNARLGTEIETLKQSTKLLQETLSNRYDYKEQSQRLHAELSTKSDEWNTKQTEYENALCNTKHDLELLKESHAREIDSVREELQSESKNLEHSLNQDVLKMRQMVDEEKQLRMDSRREQEGELAKVKMEYESRIKRLQLQMTKLQSKTQNLAGNDIFRKKLQHEREASSKIIVDLRSEVADLKSKLSKNPSDSFIAGYSRHIVNSTTHTLGTTNKRRKT